MKPTLFLISICLWMMSSGKLNQTVESGMIKLELDRVQSVRGMIHIALYDQEEALLKSQKPFKLWKVPVTTAGKLQLQLDGIAAGKYALAIYHDENDNGDLDKNMLGIPKEPYGFSKNPRAKWSAPAFAEMAFEIGTQPLSLQVSLKRWKDR